MDSNIRWMTSDEFCKALASLSLTKDDAAMLFGLGRRTITRYANDEARIPPPMAGMVRLLRDRRITIDNVIDYLHVGKRR